MTNEDQTSDRPSEEPAVPPAPARPAPRVVPSSDIRVPRRSLFVGGGVILGAALFLSGFGIGHWVVGEHHGGFRSEARASFNAPRRDGENPFNRPGQRGNRPEDLQTPAPSNPGAQPTPTP